MLDALADALLMVENFVWIYLAVPLIILFGIYLTIQSKFFQIRKFPTILKQFYIFATTSQASKTGVHPLQAFFASVGGCIGIGNVVVVCTAVQLGGPGALFWIWFAAFVGMILKYAEVYLGILYRIPNDRGTYSGGPIYYLQKVIKGGWLPKIVSILFCIYGVEVLQFNLVTNSLVHNYGLDHYLVVIVLVGLVLLAGSGGVRRVGEICAVIIPVFTFFYVCMGLWVFIQNMHVIPAIVANVFASAFTGHAAIGAFAGSSIIFTMSQGIRRGCYTGDIGIGYASMIHSESCVQSPSKQASLTIMEIFLDTFIIVTTSVFLVLVTGVWKEPIHETLLVQTALSQYFPHMNIIMPIFLFLLGYSTIIAYFTFGLNASEYLSTRWGRACYYVIGAAALILFSFAPSAMAMSVMAICGGLLMVINLIGMFLLRRRIHFDLNKPT